MPKKYKIFDLGTLSTDESEALAINKSNQVAGTFKDKGMTYIFLRERENGLRIIDLTDYHDINAIHVKLNNNGRMLIWYSYFSEGIYHQKAFLWDLLNGFINLGLLSNDRCLIKGFNDRGEIVGALIEPTGHKQAFFWSKNKMVNLSELFKQQVLGQWTDIEAVAINNKGEVAIVAHKTDIDYGFSYRSKSFL